MDLTIKLENSHLNIRVVVIMETEKGNFLLEKTKKSGWYFFPGGRIKEGESSLQAAIRETFEESGLQLTDFEYVSTVENFFEADGLVREGKFQEICFVYKVSNIPAIDPSFGLQEFTKEQMVNMDIRPEIIKKLILEDKLNQMTHFIV